MLKVLFVYFNNFSMQLSSVLSSESSKINVFCANKLCGSLIHIEATVTGSSYLDMLQIYLMPQLERDVGYR